MKVTWGRRAAMGNELMTMDETKDSTDENGN